MPRDSSVLDYHARGNRVPVIRSFTGKAIVIEELCKILTGYLLRISLHLSHFQTFSLMKKKRIPIPIKIEPM